MTLRERIAYWLLGTDKGTVTHKLEILEDSLQQCRLQTSSSAATQAHRELDRLRQELEEDYK